MCAILKSLLKTVTDGANAIGDEEDNEIGEEEYLLINATDITVTEAISLVDSFGGVCFPAHIDRTANGMVEVLGDFPKEYNFNCYELFDLKRKEEYQKRFPHISTRISLIGSDAHFLWDIRDAEDFIELDDEPYSSSLVRKKLFEYLRRK